MKKKCFIFLLVFISAFLPIITPMEMREEQNEISFPFKRVTEVYNPKNRSRVLFFSCQDKGMFDENFLNDFESIIKNETIQNVRFFVEESSMHLFEKLSLYCAESKSFQEDSDKKLFSTFTIFTPLLARSVIQVGCFGTVSEETWNTYQLGLGENNFYTLWNHAFDNVTRWPYAGEKQEIQKEVSKHANGLSRWMGKIESELSPNVNYIRNNALSTILNVHKVDKNSFKSLIFMTFLDKIGIMGLSFFENIPEDNTFVYFCNAQITKSFEISLYTLGYKLFQCIEKPKIQSSVLNMITTTQRLCTHCLNSQEKLKQCSTCKVTRYCSKECQKADWPNHKKTCQMNRPPEEVEQLFK